MNGYEFKYFLFIKFELNLINTGKNFYRFNLLK